MRMMTTIHVLFIMVRSCNRCPQRCRGVSSKCPGSVLDVSGNVFKVSSEFPGSVLGCLRGFLEVSWDVFGVSWKCPGVSSEFPGSALEVSWKCPGCVLDVSWMCLGSVLDVSWVSSKCPGCSVLDLSSNVLHTGSNWAPTLVSSTGLQTGLASFHFCASSNGLQMTFKWPSNGLQVALKWPSNGLQVAFKWPSNGLQMAFKWPSNGLQMAFIRAWVNTGSRRSASHSDA